jgi:hypothetical protein
MKNCLLSFLFFIVLVSNQSCEYRDEETLYPQACDTTSVSYALDIAPLVALRCTPCHNAEAIESGIQLITYDGLKGMVDAQRLLGSIHHEVGFSPMPKDRSKLNECEIMTFDRWVADGAQNN